MVKVNNLIEGLSNAQIRMLGVIANIEWCKAIERNRKGHAAELRKYGIEFTELVEVIESKYRLILFGTDDYFQITGKLDPFEGYNKMIS